MSLFHSQHLNKQSDQTDTVINENSILKSKKIRRYPVLCMRYYQHKDKKVKKYNAETIDSTRKNEINHSKIA